MSHKPKPTASSQGEPPQYPPFGSRLGGIIAEERKLANMMTLNNGSAKPAPKGKKKKAKAKSSRTAQQGGAGSSLLLGGVSSYLDQLKDPRSVGHGKVPLNPMGVPTNSSFTYRAYNTISTTVTTGTSTSVDFFPGHAEAQGADPVDLVSAHAKTQLVNATNFVVGPASDGTRNPCMGILTTGGALDVFPTASNTASSAAFGSAEAAPFTASDNDGFHTRWRLQSLEVVIENTTALQSAGGDVAWVMPDHSSDDAALGLYMKYASFRRENAIKPIRIKWLPRARDLYWWHSQHTTGDTGFAEVGLRILLNNSTAASQVYRINWIANWEVSGAKYAQLSTPTVESSQGQNIVPRAINAARNHSGTVENIHAHAEVEAAGAVGPSMKNALSARLQRMGQAATRAVADHARRVLGDTLGGVAGAALSTLL